MYAARKDAAENDPGKKTWNPFVRVRTIRKHSVIQVT
jgi:hypothetical protein